MITEVEYPQPVERDFDTEDTLLNVQVASMKDPRGGFWGFFACASAAVLLS